MKERTAAGSHPVRRPRAKCRATIRNYLALERAPFCSRCGAEVANVGRDCVAVVCGLCTCELAGREKPA